MIFAAWCACCAMSVAAQDCEISLIIAKAAQKEELPSQVQEILGNRLAAAVAGQGSVANSNFTPFFITAKTNTLYKETLSGPPVSTALTVDAKGVGTNINRAYINAFRAINGNNVKIQEFIREGKEKIISWYNSNYRQILVKAQKSASMHEYDAALYYVTSIPECCVGYEEASKLIDTYYTQYVNYNCQLIMQYARSEWAKSPDAEGASKAFDWLVFIEPGSSCEGEAKVLYNEIKQKVTSDWDFENREKYKDEAGLKKQRIEAARAIGVAFGNGQQPVTTNITWLH